MLRLTESQARALTMGSSRKPGPRRPTRAGRRPPSPPAALSVANSGQGGEFVIELPYPPSTNNLFVTRDGLRYKSPQARAYRKEAGRIAGLAIPVPLTGRLRVSLVFRPKRGLGMDLDNVCKAALDAIKGIGWHDDSQVWRLEVERVVGFAPGLTMTIERISE